MSSDIYADPDSSKNARHDKEVQGDGAEWEEREVDIYETADAIEDYYINIQSHEGGPHAENHPPAVLRRPSSAAALCLAALCFLLITGLILSSTHFTLEKAWLQSRYNQLSNNYSQLQSSYETLRKNHSQLQSSYETLHKNHSQLQEEVKQLKGKIEGKWCPVGWKRFGCSCYFKSNEVKTWERSREECRQKGADLVVINNKEEQNFVMKLNVHGESWIGLRSTKEKWTEGRWVWEWEWVDGSPLTEKFQASGLPQYSIYQNAATCCNHKEQWTQTGRYDKKNWICEK